MKYTIILLISSAQLSLAQSKDSVVRDASIENVTPRVCEYHSSKLIKRLSLKYHKIPFIGILVAGPKKLLHPKRFKDEPFYYTKKQWSE